MCIRDRNDFQQMMDGLRGNLYVAFDTTALALTLSMFMMFAQFLVERFESQLLSLVDQRARSEISRHYELSVAGFESQQVIEAIQSVVVNQTEIWRDSIRKAEQAWMASLTQTSDLVRGQMSESLDENVAALAHYLGESIEKADLSISHRWSQWQVALSDNARMMERNLTSLSRQTDSVRELVGTLGKSTAFDAAIKHQQAAVMATTRTHRVLNELLQKVTDAGLVPGTNSRVDSKADFSVAQFVAPVKVVKPSRNSSIKIYDEDESAVVAIDVTEDDVADVASEEDVAVETARNIVPFVVAKDDVPAEVVEAVEEEVVFEEVAEEATEKVAEEVTEDVAVEVVAEAVDDTPVEATDDGVVRLVDASEYFTTEAPVAESTPEPDVAVPQPALFVPDESEPAEQAEPVGPNKSTSAKIARSLLGDLDGDEKSSVTFSKPRIQVSRSQESDESNGNRRAA